VKGIPQQKENKKMTKKLPKMPRWTYEETEEIEFPGVEVHDLKDEFADLADMAPGCYRIKETGALFRIGTLRKYDESKQLILPLWVDYHPMRAYKNQYWQVHELLFPEEHQAEEYEPDCHRCGDGGCPSCRPNLFI
jgi:hypothetical protein